MQDYNKSDKIAYKAYIEAKKAKIAEQSKNNTLLKKYRNSATYKELYEKQHGVCAICHKPSTIALAVDHDHATGIVRGLLCSNCNMGIGLLGDSIELLYSAIQYIEHSI